MKRKLLITGGAGYLGSVIAILAKRAGWAVDILDLCLYGVPAEFARRNIRVHKTDIRDLKAVSRVMASGSASGGYDAVIHAAGIVGDRACATVPEAARAVNVSGTRNMVIAANAARVKAFIFVSTCSVYGSRKGSLIDEDSKVEPISLYGETKAEAEEIVLTAGYGRVVRMATLFGPSYRPRFDLVVNFFAAQAHAGETIRINEGSQYRPFIHAVDAAEGYIEMAEALLGDTFVPPLVNLVTANARIDHVAQDILKAFPAAVIEQRPKNGDDRNYNVTSAHFGYARRKGRSIGRGAWEVGRMIDEFDIDYKDERWTGHYAVPMLSGRRESRE